MFHVMAKPIGPICNLDCTYCFYLEKERLHAPGEDWRMGDAVLESYVRQMVAAASADGPEVAFAWQGGEPTLLGLDFFRRVVAVQDRLAGGRRVTNAIQTNGTLLDDAWCAFLAERGFLVGISIDGPAELHDAYRVDRRGRPTSDAVMRGLGLLKKHGVAFNTLTVVSRANAGHPLAVYEFLRGAGSRFIQFIPLVERAAVGTPLTVRGHELAGPPEAAGRSSPAVTPWSVGAADYGSFLCAVFDQWVRRDVGETFVQVFDAALGNWMGLGSSLCVFAETCGRAVAMEHNGDLYSCDHYVYPRYRLGNVLEVPLAAMVESAEQRRFGRDKSDTLPRYCRECEVRFACHGECPKHRFATTPDGEAGLNYLCPSYKAFFHHADPYLRLMGQLLRAGRPAADVMSIVNGGD